MDHVFRRTSERIESGLGENEAQVNQNYDFPALEWLHLRAECEMFEINTFYDKYVHRMRRNYLAILLLVHSILGTIHFIVYLTSNYKSESYRDSYANHSVNPELYCYIATVVLVWVLLATSLNERIVGRHPRLPLVMSSITIFALVLTDISIPIYYDLIEQDRKALRPAYEMYYLLLIYIFLPITKNRHCFMLGVITSLAYLTELWLVTYKHSFFNRHSRVIIEVIFVFCMNFFGVFFRLMIEVAIRRAFLDRRVYVESNVMLKLDQQQVQKLLLSVLPAVTAKAIENDISDMIRTYRDEKRKHIEQKQISAEIPPVQSIPRSFRGQNNSKLYVENYSDVSILYADIVNYTKMTTELPLMVLVETLHELFVKFDQASLENKVLRIKFLGDCYCCVSGVSERDNEHANNCVKLGLQMITDIRNIRAEKRLNIDMRIGVHSGSILSGVIGVCKWQFDIWSQDATIANRLESTGEPGKVHITQQTRDQLDEAYDNSIVPGTEKARTDELLQRLGIVTYLISPQYYVQPIQFRTTDDVYKRRPSGVGHKNSAFGGKLQPKSGVTGFMHQNSIEHYQEVRRMITEEMANGLDKIPLGTFDFDRVFNVVSKTFLCFSPSLEWAYMGEPDIILKYSTLLGFIIFVAIVSMLKLYHPFAFYRWVLHGLSVLVLFLFLVITWFNKLWMMFQKRNDDEIYIMAQPKNAVIYWIFIFSRKVIQNALARCVIYLTTVFLLTLTSLIHLMECHNQKDTNASECIRPWIITECIVLTMCVNFIFVRIYFLVKLFVGFLILGVYGWVIFDSFADLFKTSTSTNDFISPQMAHLIFVVFIIIIFHIVDRQTEYISRVDFNWKQQLIKKQEESEFTKDTIMVLVHNILPAHVADIYINRQIRDTLYSEQYDDVAIMFATILNFDEPCSIEQIDHEKNVLSILNRIICDFDEELLSHLSFVRLEKIKVTGWTYMVACGLHPGRSSPSITELSSRGSNGPVRLSMNTTKLTTRASNHQEPNDLRRNSDINFPTTAKTRNPTYVLTNFALQLMRVLNKFNQENFMANGKLRIGIAHGEVMAGVVGSSKPLYDVWGHAVNMAARMDSTGVPGRIQVTKKTADELRTVGIQCTFRGDTFVKGCGNRSTYFVSVDEDRTEFTRFGHEESIAEINEDPEVTKL